MRLDQSGEPSTTVKDPAGTLDEHPISALGFFFAAGLVGLVTTLWVIASLLSVFLTESETVSPPDIAGQFVGSLICTGIVVLFGYGITVSLYYAGMARKYPETHSDLGRLRTIDESTKEISVVDLSEDGFYKNASERELEHFYHQLSKTPESPRFAALVLEVRRRISEETD